MSGEHVIRNDGGFLQPVVGNVSAAGLTPAQLASRLQNALSGVLERPKVTVAVLARRAPSVSVLGEVRAPGQFQVAPDEPVLSVLARAGGLTEFAHPDHIYIVRTFPKPLRIRVRFEELVGNTRAASALALHNGDVIFVE